MLEVFEELNLKDMVAAYVARHPEWKDSDLHIRGRTGLRLPVALLRTFFEPVFIKIESKVAGARACMRHASHTCSLLADAGPCTPELCQLQPFKFIVLVGGFGASEWLRERMQRTVNGFPGCKLITPMRPAVAVGYGATLFGLTQASFASRIARFTYGTNMAVRMDPTNVKHCNPPGGTNKRRCCTRFCKAWLTDMGGTSQAPTCSRVSSTSTTCSKLS